MALTKLDHALSLAAQGFWIFPIRPGVKAPPAVTDWQGAAMRDPAVIRSWWGANPDHNIGIFTGKFGDGEALLVVDVDVKGGKNGYDELLRLELEGWELPETYTQHTISGGRHLVYRVPTPVRQGANVLAPALDIRSKGGYIVGCGSTIGSSAYTGTNVPVAPAPGWLVDRCGETRRVREPERHSAVAIDEEAAGRRAIHYLEHDAPLAIEGMAGDETTYKVAARLKDFGVERLDAIRLLLTHWNLRCSPPWDPPDLQQKVDNAYKYTLLPLANAAPETDFAEAPPPDPAVPPGPGGLDPPPVLHPYDQLNTEYAFVLAGGGAHILWETTDAQDRYRLEHLSLGAFHAKFAPLKMTIGKREQSVSQLWMEWKGRREYDGLVFLPAQDAPARFYNLWRGFSVEPAETADHPAVRAFLDHAHENICHGQKDLSRWLLGYCAHLVQRPWEKPLVALVLRGGKGVGKNAFVERVGALLGGHFLLTSNRRYLVGHFNGHLENCLLFALDEAFWSGDKQAEGTLKDLITGREHVIEHKGKEPYTVANKTRIVIVGNEDWLVPASHDERRFAVFDVGDARKQDRAFFHDMRVSLEVGGYRHLLRYLLDYDLTGLDFNAAPQTQALADQKHHSLDPFHQWWFDCLTEGKIVGVDFVEWPTEIPCEHVRAAVRRYSKDRNIRSWMPDDRTIGRLLKSCAPSVQKRRLSKGDEGQPYVYRLPPLSKARAEWEVFLGHPATWEESDELFTL